MPKRISNRPTDVNQAAFMQVERSTADKIHRTLRMTPAMAAGVTDRLWDVSDLVVLWEQYERRAERAA